MAASRRPANLLTLSEARLIEIQAEASERDGLPVSLTVETARRVVATIRYAHTKYRRGRTDQ